MNRPQPTKLELAAMIFLAVLIITEWTLVALEKL